MAGSWLLYGDDTLISSDSTTSILDFITEIVNISNLLFTVSAIKTFKCPAFVGILFIYVQLAMS